MAIWVLGLAIAALALAGHGLRGGKIGSIWAAIAALSIGFVVGAAAIRVGMSWGKIERDTEFAGIARVAADIIDENTGDYALFVGASYSRNGLDDERLTARLRTNGLNWRAINVSLQGASWQEREYWLFALLEAVERPPVAVFLEPSEEFDADPLYVFRVAKFSDRAIAQFSPEATPAILAGVKESPPDGARRLAEVAALTPMHFLLNWVNAGALAKGVFLRDAKPASGFLAEHTPREDLSADFISENLRSNADAPQEGRFGQAARARIAEKLHQRGINEIWLYKPPVLEANGRAYVAAICAKSAFPCIAPTDPDLLQQLEGPFWFDRAHLLADGASIYADWLAQEIIARRKNEGPAATAQTEEARAR